MATYSGGFTTPGTSAEVNLEFEVWVISQDLVANTSLLGWQLRMVEYVNGSPFRNNHDSAALAYIDGVGVYGALNLDYNFDLTNETIVIANGQRTVAHEANGTKQISVVASYDGKSPLGTASISVGGISLPTIPRASTPTYSDSTPDAGDSITITTNRADGSFTHDLEYRWQGSGSAYTSIATGVGASTSWTVPSSLINDIPNATTRVLEIRTTTKSGATTIGTSLTTVTVGVPESVVPDFGTVTHAEAVSSPDIATLIGAYVQSMSKLTLAITSAVAGTGATVTKKEVQVRTAGGTVLQTVDVTAGSAATPNPLSASGTLTLRGIVTDSRSRTYYEDVTIDVLAYSLPSVTSLGLQRALADGTPDEEGTYIRVDLNAAVQSLLVSAVQKNALTYRISTSPRDANTWTVKATTTPGGVTFNSHAEVGTYAISDAWDVKVEVYDKLTSSAPLVIVGAISTAGVFMHLGNAGEGLGVGKYWERGSVDAINRMYQRDGLAVADEDDLRELVPAGHVGWTVAAVAPSGWMLCDGSAVSRTTYPDLFEACNPVVGTFTVTIASPGVATLTGHGLNTGQMVYLTTTGALPSGLTANTAYYVIRVDANTFRLATSYANAWSGTAINTTGSQSGTHTIRRTYGRGDGSTTFNVPNIVGRTVVSRDTTQDEFGALGQSGGTKTHTHTLTDAIAAVFVGFWKVRSRATSWTATNSGGVTAPGSSSSTSPNGASIEGSTDAASSMPPYIVLNAIIKT